MQSCHQHQQPMDWLCVEATEQLGHSDPYMQHDVAVLPDRCWWQRWHLNHDSTKDDRLPGDHCEQHNAGTLNRDFSLFHTHNYVVCEWEACLYLWVTSMIAVCGWAVACLHCMILSFVNGQHNSAVCGWPAWLWMASIILLFVDGQHDCGWPAWLFADGQHNSVVCGWPAWLFVDGQHNSVVCGWPAWLFVDGQHDCLWMASMTVVCK